MLERVIRETCIAGAVIDRCIKASFPRGGKRKKKEKVTSDAVKKNNDMLALKNLTRLINLNFYPGDLHTTLTYAEELSPEEANSELEKWIKRMRREYKKLDKEFYYIAVTEFKNKRIHHHVVMNYIDFQVINRQWKMGRIRCTPLDKTRNYRVLAEYLIKETQKTFREPENATKRRWKPSRNLKRPVVKREWVSISQLFQNLDDIKPLKGYEIDRDTLRKYTNPVTKLDHLEYQMVSNEAVPRLSVWRKGKKVNRNETYRKMDEMRQMDMELEDHAAVWDVL
jgi:hypothetical protein ELI_3133|nr:MAG TPA: protein of unknown function DUF1424 [Caudoviricetes sp.]